jgi:hypothetical protein
VEGLSACDGHRHPCCSVHTTDRCNARVSPEGSRRGREVVLYTSVYFEQCGIVPQRTDGALLLFLYWILARFDL